MTSDPPDRDWEVTIRRVTNGFQVNTPDDELVFCGDDPSSMPRACMEALYAVIEALGMGGSRYEAPVCRGEAGRQARGSH